MYFISSWSSPKQWSGRFLGITGWDLGVCKSNRLHVHILWFSFIKIGIYSMISSRMIGNFPTILNFNWLFLKLNRFICNYLPGFPDHCSEGQVPLSEALRLPKKFDLQRTALQKSVAMLATMSFFHPCTKGLHQRTLGRILNHHRTRVSLSANQNPPRVHDQWTSPL